MLRLLKTSVATTALLAATLSAAPAATVPRSVPLPDDFSPEGIAAGTGSTFFVGSLVDGDIYRGDLRTGTGAVFVDAPAGRIAGGLKVDKRHHLLFVAGGPTSAGYVYDARNGSPVADFTFAAPFTAFINDVAVTRRAAYFTDSFNPVLYVVRFGHHGRLRPPRTLQLTGPAATIVPGEFGLNGITATRSGDRLIVDHSFLGKLMTVNPHSGVSRTIRLTNGAITADAPDGIWLSGKTLWVVENSANRLLRVRLTPELRSGRIVDVTTDDEVNGLFRTPTTVARFGSRLAIVNARFDLGLPPPLGTGVPPGTDYDVVVVRAYG